MTSLRREGEPQELSEVATSPEKWNIDEGSQSQFVRVADHSPKEHPTGRGTVGQLPGNFCVVCLLVFFGFVFTTNQQPRLFLSHRLIPHHIGLPSENTKEPWQRRTENRFPSGCVLGPSTTLSL